MNEYLAFWRIWGLKEKSILFLIFAIIVLLSGLTVYGWNQGLSAIIDWDIYTELREKIFENPPYYLDKFSFSSSSPVWYVSERYIPSLVTIPIQPYYIALFISILGLIFILIGTSKLKGIPFFVGLIALVILFISFRFENIFNSGNNYHFIVLFLFVGGIQWYISNFKSHITEFQKLGIWSIVWILIGFLVYKFSFIKHPFLGIAAYGIAGMMALTAIFIFLSSHEIYVGMLWLVSKNAQKGKNNLLPFLLISFIFMANAALIFSENQKYIDTQSFLVPPIFLFFIQLGLGIWGTRRWLNQSELVSFNQVGLWIYLGLALIASSTLAFAHFTGNDSLKDLIDDLVSICLLSQSVCFLVYVLVNYIQIINQGLEFHKVLYKSPFIPWEFARIAALFLVIFLFSTKNYYGLKQFHAGTKNAVADFHLIEGETKTAEILYASALDYDPYNHKSNLSLASLAISADDKITAIGYFEQSLKKIATPFAYAGISFCLENEDLYFNSLFKLNDGIKAFPDDHHLYTNLAYLQNKTHQTDSVYINLEKAKNLCSTCQPEYANMIGFWIENGKKEALDQKLLANSSTPFSLSSLANRSAIQKILTLDPGKISFEISRDSALNTAQISLLTNVSSNPTWTQSKDIPALLIRNLKNFSQNASYGTLLDYADAHQTYNGRDKIEGIKKLTYLASDNTKYKRIFEQELGITFMSLGLYDKALLSLKNSGDSSSLALLSKSFVKPKLDSLLKLNANNLSSNLSLSTYKNILKRAPLNPYLVAKISDFLLHNNKASEAYNLAFYATDFAPENPILLGSVFQAAMALKQFDYAENTLSQLKSLIPQKDYLVLQQQLLSTKSKIQHWSN
ncbi:MAG: hypothetical protein ACRCVT_13355 [Leadbetterella sp.]